MASMYRLLSLAYWAEADPGPLSPAGQVLYLALGLLLAAGALIALRALRLVVLQHDSDRHEAPMRRQAVCHDLCDAALRAGLPAWLGERKPRPGAFWAGEIVACALGLGAVALRLAGTPGWSARAWTGGPVALALGLVAAAELAPAWPALRQGWRSAWAWRPAGAQLAPAAALSLLALHGLALAVSSRLAGWPPWAAPALLLALLLPQLLARPPRLSAVTGWSVLLPAYLLAALAAAARVAAWAGRPLAPLPLPLGPALAVLAAYAVAYQAYALAPARLQRRLTWAAPALLGAGTLTWAGWAYLGLRAHGVTGADPYAYVQMAVDFARHGTALHRFPLAGVAQALGIDPEPLLHVGYRLPLDAGGRAATVWPTGHSLLLGLAGALAGEPAIYLATPLMALASIVATAWLGRLLFDDLSSPLAWLAGSLAGLLVGTSFEQLRWTLVHMADISAQLFSVLAVALAWLGAVRGRRGWWAAAGLALAMAYWTRHTQLAMALPLLALLPAAGERPRRARLLDGVACLGAALLGALPDLAYHQYLFGSPLRPESKELALYALNAVPATTALLVREWLAAPELGLLAPFLLAGAVALGRRNRRAGLALGVWLVGLWAVQAPYASLRVRDLLPALPALALVAGYGIVRGLAWVGARRREGATLLALAVVALLWLRTADTATLPQRRSFDNFGYLWPGQRAEFASLAGQLEPDAAVGATLNSGAVDLYGERQAFRPAGWSERDLQRFLQALWAEGQPTYLLDDGAEMAPVLAAVRSYARLTPAAHLSRVPYFAPDGGSEVRDVVLYEVEGRE